MKTELDILQMAQALAAHASARQVVIAENIANADTPGFKARDLRPFTEIYQQSPDSMQMRTTRPGHFSSFGQGSLFPVGIDRTAEASPNGNSVSLEQQMTKAAELRQEYDLALGIYTKSLAILRKSLGR